SSQPTQSASQACLVGYYDPLVGLCGYAPGIALRGCRFGANGKHQIIERQSPGTPLPASAGFQLSDFGLGAYGRITGRLLDGCWTDETMRIARFYRGVDGW